MDVVDSNLVLEMSQELVGEMEGHDGDVLLARGNTATNSDKVRDKSTTDCYVVIDGSLWNVQDVDAQTLDRLKGLDIQQLDKQKEGNIKIKLKISAEHAASNKDKRLFSCKGVIADWPYDIPELWKNMVDKDKDDIIKIERMKRRIWNKQTNKRCPVFQKNKELKVIMAHNNISFIEAEKLVFGKHDESSMRYDRYTNHNAWPALGLSKRNKQNIQEDKSDPQNEISNTSNKTYTTERRVNYVESHEGYNWVADIENIISSLKDTNRETMSLKHDLLNLMLKYSVPVCYHGEEETVFDRVEDFREEERSKKCRSEEDLVRIRKLTAGIKSGVRGNEGGR
ncbi:hypothetical protein DMN91_000223 [Ooceraea biroi]|uniref:Uncharacterized protein n=2 Tax=Ooceraea biroi TaxID=2015173 RepID=A0A3L8E2K8_OOCBI|nr:hypothetical protein DMN91_000223 [Ooceraea biroi]